MAWFCHLKEWQHLGYRPVKVDSTTLMVYDRLLLHKPLVESGPIYLDNVVVNFPSLRAILALHFFRQHSFLDMLRSPGMTVEPALCECL